MDAHEHNSIYIKDLGWTMDQAWGSLKKSWRQLKYNLTIGDFDRVETLRRRKNNPSRWCDGAGEWRTFDIEFEYLVTFYTIEAYGFRLCRVIVDTFEDLT